MAWNTPSTWVAGALTAAQMNAQVRDNFKAIGDPWTSWSPTWTAATTNPVLGNGVKSGGYSAQGKMVNFWIQVVMGTTTTYGTGAWQFDLPFSESAHRWSFAGTIRDTSAAVTYPIVATREGSGQLIVRSWNTTAGGSFFSVSGTSPFGWASTDELFISGTYEAT